MTRLDLQITQTEGVPVYQQIINQLKNLAASGRLKPDQEIPPIRKLAEQLLINPNTVARAYRELELSGWVYKRRGAGTFIAKKSSPFSKAVRHKNIEDRIDGLLTEAYQMNLSVDEIIDLIRRVHAQRELVRTGTED